MTRKEQMDDEFAVFHDFSGVCSLEIQAQSIESRSPPDPDIFCVMDGQPVAFELVELVDSSVLETIKLQMDSKECLEDAYRSLSVDKREQFDLRYRRSVLSFCFSSDAGLTKRKKVISKVFDILIGLRHSLDEFVIKNDSDLMPILRSVKVRGSSLASPLFHVDGFGYVTDPTFNALSGKMRKKYRVSVPLELLAYVCWDFLPHRDEVFAAAQKACLELSGSPFRRVWIFDCIRREIVFVSPVVEP